MFSYRLHIYVQMSFYILGTISEKTNDNKHEERKTNFDQWYDTRDKETEKHAGQLPSVCSIVRSHPHTHTHVSCDITCHLSAVY